VEGSEEAGSSEESVFACSEEAVEGSEETVFEAVEGSAEAGSSEEYVSAGSEETVFEAVEGSEEEFGSAEDSLFAGSEEASNGWSLVLRGWM